MTVWCVFFNDELYGIFDSPEKAREYVANVGIEGNCFILLWVVQ